MDLDSGRIHDVVHPTAAFSSLQQQHVSDGQLPWSQCQLNPANRINSLDMPREPVWRIDGCAGQGTQFHVVPKHLGQAVAPLRIDVFVAPPETTSKCRTRGDLLDLGLAFHTRDGPRLQRLAITRLILRTLQRWSTTPGCGGDDSLEDLFRSAPFGSRILLENLDSSDDARVRVTVARTFDLERSFLAAGTLSETLRLGSDACLPPTIDLHQLRLVRQLHDSVCVVRREPDDGRLWAFKSMTSGTKYLYIEMRNLLLMDPHPHVMSRPENLVIKCCEFGGKRDAVVGFLMPYYARGSLRDEIPFLQIHDRLLLETRIKWASQLTEAMVHVQKHCQVFYPDLRLENMVLSDNGDLVVVDFEQRGVWCEFGAPEVNAIDYMRLLASDSDTGYAQSIPESRRQRYAALLDELLPAWSDLQDCDDFASLPPGYNSANVAWLCLSPTEQEAAVVFMLGRVLWCIFEGQCAPSRTAVWQSYPREPDYDFPNFHRTPHEMRGLIDRCTRGRRAELSRLVTRRGGMLVLQNEPNTASAEDVQRVASDFWRKEVLHAESFLQDRQKAKKKGEWMGNFYKRPDLSEVLSRLEAFRARTVLE